MFLTDKLVLYCFLEGSINHVEHHLSHLMNIFGLIILIN